MPRTLLLADDSITIQKVVAITFQNEDFAVAAVDNGEDALAKARELKPDIILADVVMPRRNGYELCQAVKSDPALRHIPVLLLAGTFEPFDAGKAAVAQANGHLAKPFDSQHLIDAVNALVSGQPMPAAAPARPAYAAAAPAAPAPVAPAPFAPAVPRPMAPTPAAAPPSFAMPRPPAPQAPAAIPPVFAAPGMPVAPTAPARPPVAAPAPPRAPMPLVPGSPALPPTLVPGGAPRPMAGTPTPMLIPGGLPPAGRPLTSPPAGLGAPPPSPMNVPAPAGIRMPSPSRPPPAPLEPPAPVARSSAPTPVSISAPWAVPGVPAAAPPAAPPVPQRTATTAWSAVDATAVPASAAPFRSPAVSSPTPTPSWGIPLGRAAPFEPKPPAAPPRPASAPSVVVDPRATVPAELAVDVSLDEDFGQPTPARPSAPGPVRASASVQLDIEEAPAIQTSALADLSQGSARAAVGEIEIEADGSPGDQVELAAPHEFLSPAAARAPVAPPAPVAAAPAAKAADGGEAALRAALSSASREVIERIAWEVVPQLAEVILREHVERLAKERGAK